MLANGACIMGTADGPGMMIAAGAGCCFAACIICVESCVVAT